MKVVSVWLRDPVSGWENISPFEFKEHYETVSEFLADFLKLKDGFQIEQRSSSKTDYAYSMSFELSDMYALKHPEYNQAHWQAHIVLTEEVSTKEFPCHYLSVLNKIADCQYSKIDFSDREKEILAHLRDDLTRKFCICKG